MKATKKELHVIPVYDLAQIRPLHREEAIAGDFGYHDLPDNKKIPGFELYSSIGMKGSLGPVKSTFYRMSITVTGHIDVQLGLERYRHQPGTVHFTFPNQVFMKGNISEDAFGYYLLFNPDFLDEFIPRAKMEEEFPFFGFNGVPFFQTQAEELSRIVQLLQSINKELRQGAAGVVKAVKMYVYLLLLEARRSYDRQQLYSNAGMASATALVTTFKKLVSQHCLYKRQVSNYAALLHVTPNHLNRTVKEVTGETASDHINAMLLQEAKALLKFTGQSVAEISYQLQFSDPSTFNRFFRKLAGVTPAAFRQQDNIAYSMQHRANNQGVALPELCAKQSK